MLAHVDGFHGGDEVVAGHGLAVVAAEVLVHAGAKAFLAQQSVLHADDFGAFLVHGGRVEVADLLVTFRPDRMGHGTGVFRKLGGAQRHNVVDALDRAGARGLGGIHAVGHHVGAEFLVAKDGQAFLQAQLEPVAAGDAVAGPVVEVLVSDDGFDAFIVGVRGRIRIRQHVGGVEDVQALVFHRAHVEVMDGHDHETVQVQLQAEAAFVPAQRAHQRIQRPFGLGFRARVAVDLQQHVAAAGRLHGGFAVGELACHQREQVAGLGEGIFPFDFVAAVGQLARGQQVAVGQQHRILGLGAQGHAVARHHVGPVGEPGDAAKTFGFALGEEVAARDVQAHQRGIGRRFASADDFHRGGGGQAVKGQAVFGKAVTVGGQGRAIHAYRDEFQVFAVQDQGGVGAGPGLALHLHRAAHFGRVRREVEGEGDFGNVVGVGLVILAIYGYGRVCAHGIAVLYERGFYCSGWARRADLGRLAYRKLFVAV
jgi:hypothetical protein